MQARQNKIVPIRPEARRRAKPKIGRIRLTLYLILFFAVMLSVIAFVVYRDDLSADSLAGFFGGIGRLFSGESEETADAFAYDDFMLSRYGALQDGFAMLSPTRFVMFSSGGTQRYAVDVSLQNPALEVSQKTALLYDRGGTSLLLGSSRGVSLEQTWPNEIYTARMNAAGWFVVVSPEEGYKAAATVMDAKGKGVIKWYSDQYILDACLSADGKTLAVLSSELLDGRYVSRLTLVDTQDADRPPKAETALPEDLFFSLCWKAGGEIWVVGEAGAVFFDADGQKTGAYDYRGRTLLDCDTGGDRLLLRLSSHPISGFFELVAVDAKGTETAARPFEERPTGLSAGGARTSLLIAGRLLVMDEELQTVLDTDAGDARGLLQKTDGAVMLLSDDGARIVRP